MPNLEDVAGGGYDLNHIHATPSGIGDSRRIDFTLEARPRARSLVARRGGGRCDRTGPESFRHE